MKRNRKIRCYINGEYLFTTTKFSSQKALKNYLRNVKHIEIASIPVKYVTISILDDVVVSATYDRYDLLKPVD